SVGLESSNQVVVQVSDAFGASATQSYNVNVTPDQIAPVVRLTMSANPLALGSDSVVVVQASDDVGLADVVLFRNGLPLVLDANRSITLRGDLAGLSNLRAVARDTSG